MSSPQEDTAGDRSVYEGAKSVLYLIADVAPLALGLVLVALAATVALAPRAQAGLAVATVLLFLVGNRFAGRGMSLVLAALSGAVSLRYLIWRATETVPEADTAARILGIGLLLAETYAVARLLLGYLQTAWPRSRRPRPLPPDATLWPTVDVFITSYDEPLATVRATVLAAMAMDWPGERLRVHLLDDGGRAEFLQFAADVGCNYLARSPREHATAGALNAALAQTGGHYVAVFDCDQIPTRAFLQLTMGWLLAEPRLALVQTPRHCYAPDLFQRALGDDNRIPAEADLLQGFVQDGNDFWQAALFTGSGAVLRRRALVAIGGFAVESACEDVLTTLRLHRAGWLSAFVNAPLAAGLPPAPLARYLAQHRRRTRGTLQILLRNNPLVVRGLSLGQRLCYALTCGQGLAALPRVAFLTAPLAFLLFGQNVIAAAPLALATYAVPHLFHATMTAARLRGRWRAAFWGGVYETVQALALVPLTITTLLAPRHMARREVTAVPPRPERFDLRTVWPNLVLAALLLLGIGRAAVGLALLHPAAAAQQTLLLYGFWAAVNLTAVAAALAVERVTSLPGAAAFPAALPVAVRLADGRTLAGRTRELSRAGAVVSIDHVEQVGDVQVEFIAPIVGGEALVLPVRVIAWTGTGLEVQWQPANLEDEASIVRAVFGRADAWVGWTAGRDHRLWVSLWAVLRLAGRVWQRRPARQAVTLASAATAGAVAMALLAAAAWGQQGTTKPKPGHDSGMTVRIIPQPLPAFNPQTGRLQLDAPAPAPTSPPLRIEPHAAAPPPAPAPPEAAPPAQPAEAPPPRPSPRHIVFSLHQLGAAGPLALRGTSPVQSVSLGIGGDEVVTGAQLSLSGALSPSLLSEVSNITVTLNGQYVATIPANRDRPTFQTDVPVNPVFFQDANTLSFRFSGRYTQDCNDPLSGLLWATVYDSSTLTLTLERLPPKRDLSRLPRPFFDRRQSEPLTLPFVVSGSAGNDTLRAAGIVASWFGQLAGPRSATFPVLAELPAEGNAVVVVVGGDGQGMPGLPLLSGPTLAVLANPNDQLGSLLVLAGRNGQEVATAATALALGSGTLGGETAVVQVPQLAARVPYDAPAWIATDRPVRLGELVEPAALQASGYVSLVHVPLRTAPDLATWRARPFALQVQVRAPPAPVIDLAASRLDVGIDGTYLTTLPLAAPAAARVGLPTYGVTGADDLQFYFYARPSRHDDCAPVPQDLRMSIDPDSTIDLRAGHRFAELPNLAFFAASGFPFTRMADLSETAVVMPERPAAVEVSAFLDLMGRFSALTGYPAVRVAVVRPDGTGSVADRDLLVLATLAHAPAAADLLRNTPVQMSSAGLTVALSDPLDPLRWFDDRPAGERERAAAALAAGVPAILVGGESPLRPGRSMVALLATTPQSLGGIVTTLRDAGSRDAGSSGGSQAPALQGDLALISGGKVSSFRVGPTYSVGALPLWMWPDRLLGDRPYLVLLLLVAGCALVGSGLLHLLRRRAAADAMGPPP